MKEEVRKIRIEDFYYHLPEEKIALHPLAKRDACRLLVMHPDSAPRHLKFSELPLLLRPGTLLVANETKVIRARMEFHKQSGARIEIFLLEPHHPHDYAVNFAEREECSWKCLIGNRKKWKEGDLVKVIKPENCDETVEIRASLAGETSDGTPIVEFAWTSGLSFAEIVEAAGNIPIPPYLKRESEESDTEDYQTVYSRTQGSVAAPTAGLHFTPELLAELRRCGNRFTTVTLHVGAGTFQPVKSEEIGDHPMHTEWISVSRSTLREIIGAIENGDDILAVGTTSVRTLESLPYLGVIASECGDREEVPAVTQWMPYEEKFGEIDTIRSLKNLLKYMTEREMQEISTSTSIMIAPGFRWRIVNRLITNFHQPSSTLLLLVSSFLAGSGKDTQIWRKAYDEALRENYRFLSYGDACLFSRGSQSVELPAAKSMVTRAATIMAVRNPQKLENLEREILCDDAYYYIEALRATLESAKNGDKRRIYIGEGAAPLRFLVAFAASLPGADIEITCAPPLQKRPISPLISALQDMGADVKFTESPDWLITIKGKRLKGGKISVDSSFTSQFLSALMLASPLWQQPLSKDTETKAEVSKPYLVLTEKMMAEEKVEIEPDWSAVAFFYEKALITGREITISRLTPPLKSLQGDSVCCDIFSLIGVHTRFADDGSAVLSPVPEMTDERRRQGFEFSFRDCPDLAPAVAVALCYRRIPFRFNDVGHLRFKECDRLMVLQRNLTLLGYDVEAGNDTLTFNGEFRPMHEFPVEIDPYGDHRMVMAFYPLEQAGMATIADKSAVSKSYPGFFQNQ